MLGVRKWPFSTRISTDGQLFDHRLPKVLESDVQTNGSRNQKYILMENQTLYSNARKVYATEISVMYHTNFWFQWCFCWLLWFCNKILKFVMVSLVLINKLNAFIRQEIVINIIYDIYRLYPILERNIGKYGAYNSILQNQFERGDFHVICIRFTKFTLSNQ